jgi:hydrogenase nickel incorporation protein HypA/HybF
VLSITLRIGPLSGFEPELLRAAFPLVAHGTHCEAAQIDIRTIPVVVRCKDCSTVSEVPPNRLVCASCGAWQVSLMSGDDMLLESVELGIHTNCDDGAACFPAQREGEQIRV